MNKDFEDEYDEWEKGTDEDVEKADLKSCFDDAGFTREEVEALGLYAIIEEMEALEMLKEIEQKIEGTMAKAVTDKEKQGVFKALSIVRKRIAKARRDLEDGK